MARDGLILADLAKLCGVNQSTVSRWSRSEVSIPDDQKVRLAALFLVPVSYLIKWDVFDEPTPQEKFSAKYTIDPVSGCWEWGLHRDRHGYGAVSGGRRRTLRAHRVSYELHVGPIPEGMTIDHLCMNKGCVNPDHLEPVLLAENIKRAVARRNSLPEEARAA